VEVALAGQRTALNLQGIEKEEITRGDILTEPGVFETTSLLEAKIVLLPGAKPLTHNSLVRFHHLTNDLLARITLVGQDSIVPGKEGFVQLRLQKPVFGFYGDRFILRKTSPLTTIGGGKILDPLPLRRIRPHDPDALQRLQTLDRSTDDARFKIAVEQKGLRGATMKFLKAKLALTEDQIRAIQSPAVLRLNQQPFLVISQSSADRLMERVLQTVRSFHEKSPLLPGISKEELKTRFLPAVPAEVVSAILDWMMEAKKIQLQKETVSLFGRGIVLSNAEEQMAAKAADLLIQAGLGFPGLDEFSKTLGQPLEMTKKILYLLVRESKVMKIADDYFLHKTTWEELKQKIRSLKNARKTFSVPDFKALFGISRKFAIPLLEQLDRDGVTRRSGNERIIL